MNTRKTNTSFFMLFEVLVFLVCFGCSKDEGNKDCRTCKAFTSTGSVEQQVCSDAEESSFRSANAGSEISCNQVSIACG